MRGTNILLATLVSTALGKAPLLHRDVDNRIENSYVVVMKANNQPGRVRALFSDLKSAPKSLAAVGGRLNVMQTYESVAGMNAIHIECDEETLEKMLENPMVAYAVPDGVVYGQLSIPTVVERDEVTVAPAWGLGRLSHRLPGAVDYQPPQRPQTCLFVADTGIRITHEEFGGRAVWGVNLVEGSPDTDEHGHGTHIAATAAGNTVGVDNTTTVIAVKCMDKNNAGTWSRVLTAVEWAAKEATRRGCNGRAVINMSLGGAKWEPLLQLIAAIFDAGLMLSVVAASNYNAKACDYTPASSPEALTVGAIDQNDFRAPFSNWGKCCDIFAPGVDIRSASYQGDVLTVAASGTSMAAPHVAGLATSLIAAEGFRHPEPLKRRIIELATPGMLKNGQPDTVTDPAEFSPNLIAFNGAALDFVNHGTVNGRRMRP